MTRMHRLRRIWLALVCAAWLAIPAPSATAADPEPEDAASDDLDDLEEEEEDTGRERRWRAKSEDEKSKDELAQARIVGRRNGRFLMKARELMVEEKYDEALQLLDRLNPRRLNAYERSLLYRNQGYIRYFKQDYAAAVELLEKSLEENILPDTDRNDILFGMAQIYAVQEKWPETIAALKEWFSYVQKPGEECRICGAGYFALAIAHFRMDDMDGALEPARKAVELAENPQQPWLQLLLNIYLSRRDYKAATPVMVDLLTRYPNVGKAYWLQLATLYGVQEDTQRALAILQLAHRQEFLTEDRDIRRLAGLLQNNDIPIRAAKVLEDGLAEKHVNADATAYELLGNSYIMARESDKAEPSLAKAATLSPEGDLSVRLGQVLLLKEDYDGAAVALKQALAKGGLDDPGNVELLLGITYYNAGQVAEARSWFWRARRSPKSGDIAAAWIEHIDQEIATKQSEIGAGG